MKSKRRLWRRIILVLLVLGISGLSLVFIWARQNYPAYAKDFYISDHWEESEEKVLARIENAQWKNYALAPKIEHRVFRFNQTDDWNISENLFSDLKADHQLLISVECWGSKYWPVYRSNPLSSVKDGLYDGKIKALAEELAQLNRPVYFRFNPQMEVPGRYFPWQEYPSIYIEAYQHVYHLIKDIAPKVKMLWGPAGYPGLEEFYPGPNYVDAMSINLIGASENILEVYPKKEVSEELYRRLHRLRFFNHPCLVLSGNHQKLNEEMLRELAEYQQENPAIYNSSYFYTEEITKQRDSIFKFGAYDPDGKLLGLEKLNTEHLFVDLTLFMEQGLPAALKAIAEREHDLILTLELHKDSNEVREERGLEKMLAGNYDPCLDLLFGLLDSFPNTIYLRFPQEMEIPITRYPWQSKDPKLYIDAYRYCMAYADSALGNVKMIWGPAGDRGSMEWYPGADMVDYISIAIYGLPDKNITDPNLQESFAQIYKRKSWRMRQAPESIFITEFGVKGPEDYQKQWLIKAAETINAAPELSGINYFNMHDVPKAWGDIEPPNWSVETETYAEFLEAIKPSY